MEENLKDIYKEFIETELFLKTYEDLTEEDFMQEIESQDIKIFNDIYDFINWYYHDIGALDILDDLDNVIIKNRDVNKSIFDLLVENFDCNIVILDSEKVLFFY